MFWRRRKVRADTSAVRKMALNAIMHTWSVDEAEITPTEFGFDWLPGSHIVSVRILKDVETPGAERFRLTITTDLLHDLPAPDTKFVRNANSVAGLHFPTFSLVYRPAGNFKKYFDDRPGGMYLFSSAYLHEHMQTEWMPAFLARMSILQPIWAEAQSSRVAGILDGGRPAFARGSRTSAVNGIFNVLHDVIIPAGRETSRWIGSDEFEQFALEHGQNEDCLGVGGEEGLRLQTPFGPYYAPIRLRTDYTHGLLGNGLLVETGVMSYDDLDEACGTAALLNYLEFVGWTEFPQMGCWSLELSETRIFLVHSCFIPNALFMEGLVEHLAMWALARVRQTRRAIMPNVRDLPLSEIL